MRSTSCLSYYARSAYVVVFQHYAAGQVVSVIVPATGFYRIFFKYPIVRGGFSRVQKLGFRAFENLRDFVRA